MVKNLILFALLSLALCVPFAGQVPPGDAPPPECGPVARREGRVNRREMGRLYLVQRMREKLGLSDAQTLKLMDAFDAIGKAQQKHKDDVMALALKVKAHLADPKTPDAVFNNDIADFRKLRDGFDKQLQKLQQRLLSVMTPRQQVKFLVLKRELLEGDRESRSERRPGQHRNGPRGRSFH